MGSSLTNPLGKTSGSNFTLQPVRSYKIPGGPFAKNLGETEVVKLADIERNGPEDMSRQRRGKTS